ncbi:MAG: class I tRNA ligase family protein, partial [Candidatus Nanoarchaeia archaeon]|nr:class I tRNA ligase family protein [Candidatus Nanoarchaeia archaeon]
MDITLLMTPIQIKKNPHLGNIYDWTIIDFYSKSLKNQGNSVYVPLLWNIVGKPIIKYINNDNIELTSENIEKYIKTCINNNQKYIKLFGLDFDEQIRDDEISNKLEEIINTQLNEIISSKKYVANYCPSCDKILNNDPNINYCKTCNNEILKTPEEDFFINVDLENILKKIETIEFFPESNKISIINLAKSFPEQYDLLISKKREYTLNMSLNGKIIDLDPRFATIMMANIAFGKKENNYKILIQGDVIKKMDYYMLCYFPNKLPKKIIVHKSILDDNNK